MARLIFEWYGKLWRADVKFILKLRRLAGGENVDVLQTFVSTREHALQAVPVWATAQRMPARIEAEGRAGNHPADSLTPNAAVKNGVAEIVAVKSLSTRGPPIQLADWSLFRQPVNGAAAVLNYKSDAPEAAFAATCDGTSAMKTPSHVSLPTTASASDSQV